MEEKKIAELTADECFSYLKDRKKNITDEELDKIYDNCLDLLNKYEITGQIQGMRKLIFHLQNIEKERELIKQGVNTFVYKSDIEDYVSNVAENAVKICEINDYERDIPDDIVEVVSRVKHLFTTMYVVYTDYTGKTERRIEATRRSTDPILFGSIMDRNSGVIVERFYFLGDWIDEFCDLTLDKMVSEVREKKGVNIKREISTPKDIEELKARINSVSPPNQISIQHESDIKDIKSKENKPSLFKRIIYFILGKKHE